MSKVPSMNPTLKRLLKNKYVLVMLSFFVYLLALEETDLITLTGYKMKVHELENQEAYYLDQLEQTKTAITELTTDDAALERFAREHHFMKRENEDVFVFLDE
jgi:cell division protein DivIC